MTEEKLKEGQKLLDRLSGLKTQESIQEKCTGISELRLEIGRSTVGLTNTSFINLDDLKALVLSKIQRRIDEVQQQFNNL